MEPGQKWPGSFFICTALKLFKTVERRLAGSAVGQPQGRLGVGLPGMHCGPAALRNGAAFQWASQGPAWTWLMSGMGGKRTLGRQGKRDLDQSSSNWHPPLGVVDPRAEQF